MNLKKPYAFCYIYGLREPGTDTIMYVGRTVDPFQRLKDHIADLFPNKRGIWIQSLLDDGIYPVMDIIAICPIHLAHEKEVFWIKYFKKKNPDLVNAFYGKWNG